MVQFSLATTSAILQLVKAKQKFLKHKKELINPVYKLESKDAQEIYYYEVSTLDSLGRWSSHPVQASKFNKSRPFSLSLH